MSLSFSSSRAVAWTLWAAVSVFYAYQYILRVMPSIMLGDIMQHFQIDAAAFGQFSGVYYIGYSLMHLPIGLMLDRYGPRKIISGAILLTAIGLLPLIFADRWVYPILGRILTGMGSSAAILGVFKIVRMAFREALFSRMLSFSVTIGLIGAIYGGGPVDAMCRNFGYQTVLQLAIGAAFFLSFLSYWIIPEIKEQPKRTPWADIKEVLSNHRVLLVCLSAGFMVGPLEGFADVWGKAFLQQVYGFEPVLASSIPSMVFMGMCFGAPLLSFIAEKSNFLLTIIGAGVAMTACFGLLLLLPLTTMIIGASFILVGICSAYQILAIHKASTYVREEVAGLTAAVANMIIMLFGYGFHSIIGGVIQFMGGASDSSALLSGVAVIPITLIVGSLGFTLLHLKETSV